MKKKVIFITLCLLMFIIITILVCINHIQAFDDFIYEKLFQLRSNSLDVIMKGITTCGNTIPIIIMVIGLAITLPKREKILAVISPTTIMGMNWIIKHIICRPRPDHLRLIKQGGYSYPSGHAMVSIAVYGFLISYVLEYVKDKKWKIAFVSVFTLLILGIGMSRIYVGVHYPSDVIAGYFLAIAMETVIVLFGRGYKNDKNGSK